MLKHYSNNQRRGYSKIFLTYTKKLQKKLSLFIISFMLIFFTSNFSSVKKIPALSDNSNIVFILGNNTEGTKEYNFSKVNKIEPFIEEQLLNDLIPIFLEKIENILTKEEEKFVSYLETEISIFYNILERYRCRLLLI